MSSIIVKILVQYCIFIFSVIDCQVSDWSDWSKCDVACGIGSSTRTREVLRPESNGGRQCPALEESRSCRATKCSTRTLDKISALKGKDMKSLECNEKISYSDDRPLNVIHFSL